MRQGSAKTLERGNLCVCAFISFLPQSLLSNSLIGWTDGHACIFVAFCLPQALETGHGRQWTSLTHACASVPCPHPSFSFSHAWPLILTSPCLLFLAFSPTYPRFTCPLSFFPFLVTSLPSLLHFLSLLFPLTSHHTK